MPGAISGRDLADRLVASNPALKVLFTSGYSSEIVMRELEAGRHLLQKPYKVGDLAAAVRACLDELARAGS